MKNLIEEIQYQMILTLIVIVFAVIYCGIAAYFSDLSRKRYHIIKQLFKENNALKAKTNELNINSVGQRFWCLDEQKGAKRCCKICTACNIKP